MQTLLTSSRRWLTALALLPSLVLPLGVAAGAPHAPAAAPGTVRVAGIVLKWLRGDKAANYRRAEPLIRQAAAGGARLVCTTECFLDGYAIADKSIPLETYRALGEPIPDGEYFRKLSALAGELKILLIAGMLEADGQARYNTAVLIGPDGRMIGKYHKQHLEHEAVRNTAGSESSVFDTPLGKVGVMICADRRLPEVVKRFCDRGADYLVCPSGGMFGPTSNDPILQARSKENGKHIVFVHPAEFLVTGPDGAILQRTILGNKLVISPAEVGTETDSSRVFYFDLPLAAQTSPNAPSHATGTEEIPFDLRQERWLIDPVGVVARNDVVYTSPSVEPWEAMPTGGGDLSAMVRWDGSLHLHLSKSDCWGFQAPSDALPGTRFFNNTSPGHIRLDFGGRAKQSASRRFRQRLDLYRGRIVVELGDERAGPRIEVWGHPTRKVLVLAVTDPAKTLGAARIELSQWRPGIRVGAADETVHACEVHERPARPHLANTGMQEFFGPDRDPLCGRGTGVIVSSPAVKPASCTASGLSATLVLPDQRPTSYHVIVAAAVTQSGDPLAAARRELEEAARASLATLEAEQQAWWRDFWSRSLLRVTSPDKTADRLCAAYHVHLYTLGCVNRGPYPAKWDGGPGLMRGDERTWGLSEWVQEIRFTYLPLYAANRLDMARGLTRHYSAMTPYLQEQTRKMWALPGLWIPETVLPWGHAEDFVLKDDGRGAAGNHFVRRAADKVPYGRFELYNPYIGFLFTAGLEICQHYLVYYRYSGDDEFLRRDAYPVLRGVCEFLAGLLRKEADGRYHLEPANALETWWMVRDPADTMAGIRAVFPEFIRLAEQYDQDPELRRKCAAILAALPEPARGLWAEDGKIDAGVDVYAPATASTPSHPRINAENPALYRVFPFDLSGIASTDHDLARRTFQRRICTLWHGWSMDAVWAARLGLRDEACQLLAQHAERFHRFRYGGWTSNDSRVFPGGLSSTPFLDAGGLSAFAMNEILLQSHNGVLRIAPAVAKTWSGTFRLRAEGGFLVGADFRDGRVRVAQIESLGGRECVLASPWPGPWVVRQQDRIVVQGEGPTIRFATKPGGVYQIESGTRPASAYRPAAIHDAPNQSPGVPGRPEPVGAE